MADKKEIKWYIIDAKDKILGRLAVKIAQILMGKHKPNYSPHIVNSDGVIVINARQVKVTGKKLSQKFYKYYSGYHDGLRETPFSKMLEKRPEEIIRHAVKGMLPKNKLTKIMLRRLKVYPNDKHPHQAQNPILLN
ncbi:MAG: 50S ribosomal protein L13 [Candidatus Omnitrophica bacterium]|nr:50S ribosomal protein L13 [Candidatus Omnitrophota bacterium]